MRKGNVTVAVVQKWRRSLQTDLPSVDGDRSSKLHFGGVLFILMRNTIISGELLSVSAFILI